MEWYKINNVNDLPQCCGYAVLLTIENIYSKHRKVISAFTNYCENGKFGFLTNERPYMSTLNDSWKPIAWCEIPKPYEKGGE